MKDLTPHIKWVDLKDYESIYQINVLGQIRANISMERLQIRKGTALLPIPIMLKDSQAVLKGYNS